MKYRQNGSWRQFKSWLFVLFFSPILFRSMIVLVDVLAEGEMANWICLKFFKRSWLVNSFSASPPTSMIYQLQMLFTISLLAPIQKKKEKLTDSLYDHCVYFVRAEFEFVSGQTVCETQRECGHLLLGAAPSIRLFDWLRIHRINSCTLELDSTLMFNFSYNHGQCEIYWTNSVLKLGSKCGSRLSFSRETNCPDWSLEFNQ